MVVKCVGLIFIGVMTVVICMTMNGREVRHKELQNNLHNVVEQTMSIAKMRDNDIYDISTNNELMADTVQNMAMSVVTDSDFQYDFYGVDAEKGLLSVNVTENYKHPNNRDGKVENERTVIYNKQDDTEDMYTVKFYLTPVDTDCYMLFNVHSGDSISAPVNPTLKGKEFVVWQDENGYLADFTQPIMSDISYYASWR